MIHPESGSRIRAAVPISDVVGSYVRLKKSGPDDLTGLCPFHQEKTPSFKVHPQAGFFKCFGCGKVGDVITFVKEIERKTFPEVIESLAQQYNVNISPERDSRTRKQILQQRETVAEISREARVFWREFGRQQWLRIRMCEGQIRRFMEWSWENELDDDLAEQVDVVWEAADQLIALSEGCLRWMWGLTIPEMIREYSKIRSSILAEEMRNRIARDPINRIASHLGVNNGVGRVG
jgi:hypothetical protein